jgi:hypothetical protein
MAPPQAVREIEPITSAARAFRAPSTEVAQMFGPDVALKENVPATSGGDPGSSLPVLHALTLRPMFAGLREAATLQPSSRSAYEVLPNESANAHSIVQTLRLQATAGGGTAVISLAPKYLGSVTVSLRVVDGGVTATLHAESPSVRAWIDANVPLLRDGLAEQGLRLERVIVAETPESRHNGEDHTRDEHERPPVPTRRPRRREDRTFDVVV